MTLRFFIVLISIGVSSVVYGQAPVKIDVLLSNDSMMIGESLLYNVVVQHDKGWSIMGEPVADFSNFEITKIRKMAPKVDGQNVTEQVEYSITTFNVETIRIKPPRVWLTNGADTLAAEGPEKTVVVFSSIDSNFADIRPEKPIIPAKVNWWLLILIVLLGLLLVSAIVYGAWRLYEIRKRRLLSPVTLPEPARSPEEVALERLDQLADEALPRSGFFKEYHSRKSEILRWYIEQKFTIPAHESTTSDLVSCFRDRRLSDDGFRTSLRRFLEVCDLVKFAKYIPNTTECDEVMELARTLVRYHSKSAATVEMVQ